MFKKNLSIPLLIALVGFPQISETIYTPSLPDVAAGLSASATLVEATLSIYFFGFAVGVLLWGTLSDIFGRRCALIAGLVTYAIGTFFCGHSTSIEMLLFWRFIQAFGASVGSVITQTIIRDSYKGSEKSKLFSTISAALAFSPAIGPLAGGYIGQYFGWRTNFWTLDILAIVLIVWSCVQLPETKPQTVAFSSRRDFARLLKRMFSSKNLWGYILLIGAINGILFGFYQEAPFVFIDGLELESSTYGLFGLLIALATIISSRHSFVKSKELAPEQIIRTGVICVLAGSGLFLLFVMTEIFYFGKIGITLTVLSLFSVFYGIGLIIPNGLSKALASYQQQAGAAGSLFGTAYYILIACFTLLMGLIHNGTALPLPLYMLVLGIILALGSYMIAVNNLREEAA